MPSIQLPTTIYLAIIEDVTPNSDGTRRVTLGAIEDADRGHDDICAGLDAKLWDWKDDLVYVRGIIDCFHYPITTVVKVKIYSNGDIERNSITRVL